MTWFNWHTPSITPAQFAFCVAGLIVIEALIWIVRRAMKEGEVSTELHEHVDGSGR